MVQGLTLVCPVRGRLKAKAKGRDGLTPTEERFRVEALKHLVDSGYPVANIRVEAVIKRFGNSGRNSFRADFVVLDVPVASVGDDVDEILKHAVLLAEVKRDNVDAASAKSYQVKPMLDFAVRDDCVALYWDDVERRVFWTTRRAGAKVIHEGPLSDLPMFGAKPGATPLTFNTISADVSLLSVFSRIEDLLHSSSISESKRFDIIMQLLLAKLHDEHQHQNQPDAPLDLQDFAALDISPATSLTAVNRTIKQAVDYYQRFLPESVDPNLPATVPGTLLVEIMRVLAPVKVVAMHRSVIQDFYMYFAKHIYRWDLAQYFTPTPVTEFIVELLNPRFGEHVKDPACGSADFLTSTFRRGNAFGWTDYASSIWGSDISPEAVQVGVLNMILHGDGKTNIKKEDSLATIKENAETCDVVVCNPPFGSRIVEKRAEVLSNFDLGHKWSHTAGSWSRSSDLLSAQETGILFAEACVRLLRSGGRVALVVPNGYLGNRSPKFLVLREWLLRHTRIAAIIGLPRFTFKGSGADVSASVIFCEKRETPLKNATDSEDYEFAVEVINRVGWVTGDKKASPSYIRDESDGTLILGEDGDPQIASDFPGALSGIRSSDASADHNWLTKGVAPEPDQSSPGWTVEIGRVLSDPLLTLDPKRHSRKYCEVREKIENGDHFRLGDVVDFIGERSGDAGERREIVPATPYRYVEIQDVEIGSFRWTTRRGWELPDRARHFARPGDIFIGGIWNSVKKWFIAGASSGDLIVTNGFHRLRVKPGFEDYLPDLVAGLCTESHSVQMRALARGSDGLAEISPVDAAEVLFPRLTDPAQRVEVQPFVNQLLAGHTTVEALITTMMDNGRLPHPRPPARPDHTSIV
ncbi:HsdM family class I SAM-dependent methyltransferase [Promicromonospora soli]|uniref:DNA methylase adenine-specific domain-containing protein n=1 Tax=Promicromonospora soli TaxID=2035533 RepID=A0A919L0L5_9MICO|nr:N-6 DNA methylase [Promicromonospora soli]GHH80455.1 hypothetical protein GCM10017772_48590 [Promicromonospora soli]